MNEVNSESKADYSVKAKKSKKSLESLVKRAKAALLESLSEVGALLTSPDLVKDYLILELAAKEREEFGLVYLDNKHRVIKIESLFFGTIDSSAVYPREVVKFALAYNASAVIFYHNHPSGITEASGADKQITTKLINALSVVDIRVLDHIIVGGTKTLSFAEKGYL